MRALRYQTCKGIGAGAYKTEDQFFRATTMKNKSKEKMCCICGKKKATNIPFADGSPCYINMGACNKPACVLARMRQVG